MAKEEKKQKEENKEKSLKREKTPKAEETEAPKVPAKEPKPSKQELMKEKLDRLHEEEDKVLSALRSSNYQQLVSDCYTEMDAYINMVSDGISTGCIIEGSGGTGKSYRSLQICKDKDIAYVDSFATPANLYILLYKNRDKDVIIFDDCSSFLSNEKILAFLKGALWEVNGKRIVSYYTTKPLKDEYDEMIPNTFEINSSIIIITNHINKENAHVQAVLSRVQYCYVEIPRDELLYILRQISEKDYPNLTKAERTECFNFLKENTSHSTIDLNIRTLFKIFQFRVFAKKHGRGEFWKILANKCLKKDDQLVLIETLESNEELKVDQKVQEFMKLTNQSRATYFRLKRKLEKQKSKSLKEKHVETNL